MKVNKSIIVLVLLSFMSITAIGKGTGKENGKEKTDNAEKISLIPKISGLANIRYSYDDDKATIHGFDVRRVRLSVKGDVHKNVDYCIQGEYATNVKLLDAYFRCKIVPEFNIQVGEFKTESSLESTYGPTSWLVIQSPTAVTRLNGYDDLCGIKANGRDVGLRFYGSFIHKENFNVLRYSAGIYNGAGINVKDNNKQKDVAGFLWINPMRKLTFTGGYYYGTYGPKGATHVRNRASAGVEWKDTKLTVRSEYLWGNTGGLHSNGAYIQTAYTFCRMIQPVLSYDYFKRHTSGNSYEHNAQVGINITPIKYLRIQAAYTHTFLNANGHRNRVEVQAIASF